jgi:acetyltransferase-like isoleucine patch superfamily enzyme
MRPLFFQKKKLLPRTNGTSRWKVSPSSAVYLSRNSQIEEAEIEEHVTVDFLETHIAKLKIGRCTYAGQIKALGLKSGLSIGRYGSIGSDVIFVCGSGYHLMDRLSSYPFPFRDPFRENWMKGFYSDSDFDDSQMEIGHDVWIGHRSIVLKDVRIGNGAVIAVGSLVTEDVPPYAVVAGNPASIKRYRHDPETIQLLEQLQWWNWSPEEIRRQAPLFKLTGSELRAALGKLPVHA